MKKLQWIAVVLASLLVAACSSSSKSVESDDSAAATTEKGSEIPHMSWDEVAQAVAGGAVLVDARGPVDYQKGHIEGAINVPIKQGDAVLDKLPDDKATQLIFYCGGPSCQLSNKCAQAAMNRGYAKVAEYKGGYPEWAKAQAAASTESAATAEGSGEEGATEAEAAEDAEPEPAAKDAKKGGDAGTK